MAITAEPLFDEAVPLAALPADRGPSLWVRVPCPAFPPIVPGTVERARRRGCLVQLLPSPPGAIFGWRDCREGDERR